MFTKASLVLIVPLLISILVNQRFQGVVQAPIPAMPTLANNCLSP